LRREPIFRFQCIGGVTAALKRLRAAARRLIFLIVDRGPTLIARKTQALSKA
jgi:hypothetical protein